MMHSVQMLVELKQGQQPSDQTKPSYISEVEKDYLEQPEKLTTDKL